MHVFFLLSTVLNKIFYIKDVYILSKRHEVIRNDPVQKFTYP